MKKERLLSLDAFRGITMASMLIVENPGNWSIYRPFRHASWGYPDAQGNPIHEAITPTDFILPFFIFIMGVAVVFALSKKKENVELHREAIVKVVKRFFSLFALGIFFYAFSGLLDWALYGNKMQFQNLQFTGVLHMLAITYLISSLAYLKLSTKGLVACVIGLPVLMCILTTFVPIPGFGEPILIRQWHAIEGSPANMPKNLHNFVDTVIYGYGKPDGLLTSISASINAILGVLCGLLIASNKEKAEKVSWLLSVGVLLASIGWIWGQFFPIIKDMWTGPYTYVTGGLAMMGLGVCYWFIDVQGKKAWTKPFVAYGVNCLAVYVASHLVGSALRVIKLGNDMSLHSWIMKNVFESWLSPENASLAFALTTALVWLIPLLYMFKKKIIIKI